MNCTRCGEQLKPGREICPACGKGIDIAPELPNVEEPRMPEFRAPEYEPENQAPDSPEPVSIGYKPSQDLARSAGPGSKKHALDKKPFKRDPEPKELKQTPAPYQEEHKRTPDTFAGERTKAQKPRPKPAPKKSFPADHFQAGGAGAAARDRAFESPENAAAPETGVRQKSFVCITVDSSSPHGDFLTCPECGCECRYGAPSCHSCSAAFRYADLKALENEVRELKSRFPEFCPNCGWDATDSTSGYCETCNTKLNVAYTAKQVNKKIKSTPRSAAASSYAAGKKTDSVNDIKKQKSGVIEFCPNCGTKVLDHSVGHCTKCGAHLISPKAAEPAEEQISHALRITDRKYTVGKPREFPAQPGIRIGKNAYRSKSASAHQGRPRRNSMPVAAFWFTWLMSWGIILYTYNLITTANTVQPMNWALARGIVAESMVSDAYNSTDNPKEQKYSADVYITYTVEGVEFRTTSMIMENFPYEHNDWQAAQSIVDQYPPGLSVDLFYNPDDPEQTTLSPREPVSDLSRKRNLFTWIIYILCFGVIIHVYLLWKKAR